MSFFRSMEERPPKLVDISVIHERARKRRQLMDIGVDLKKNGRVENTMWDNILSTIDNATDKNDPDYLSFKEVDHAVDYRR